MFGRDLFPADFSAYANTVLACLPDLNAIDVGMVVLVSVIRSSDVPMLEAINQESLCGHLVNRFAQVRPR